METVESGWAGTKKRGPGNKPEEKEVPGKISDRGSINPEEHGDSGSTRRSMAIPGRAVGREADTGLNMGGSSTGQLR